MQQNKNTVLSGILNLMILKTLDTLGPLHGYGIARHTEQIRADRFQLNQWTMYPTLLNLGQREDLLNAGRVGKQPVGYIDHACKEKAAYG